MAVRCLIHRASCCRGEEGHILLALFALKHGVSSIPSYWGRVNSKQAGGRMVMAKARGEEAIRTRLFLKTTWPQVRMQAKY